MTKETSESNGSTTRHGDEGTEEWTRDMFAVTTTEFATVECQSDLLGFHLDNDDVDIGFKLLQDGSWLGLSAGLIDKDNDGPRVQSFHSLTLEEARGFHQALGDAIAAAEEASKETSEEKDHQSMIEKLMEAI